MRTLDLWFLTNHSLTNKLSLISYGEEMRLGIDFQRIIFKALRGPKIKEPYLILYRLYIINDLIELGIVHWHVASKESNLPPPLLFTELFNSGWAVLVTVD